MINNQEKIAVVSNLIQNLDFTISQTEAYMAIKNPLEQDLSGKEQPDSISDLERYRAEKAYLEGLLETLRQEQ
jgi:hypothetical protein